MKFARRSWLGAAGAFAFLSGFSSRRAGAREPALPGRTKNTRFACNVEMWFTELPFPDRIAAAAALGYPAVELWDFRSKDVDRVDAAAQSAKIEIAQFTAWGFTPGLNETKNHDAFLKQLEKACEVAKKWRCKKATVVAGNDVPDLSQERMLANVTAALKRAAPIAEANDLMLILEPMNVRVDHKGHCLYGSENAVKICREVASTHVKINWDLYHMQISEGDLCRRLREGFDQVGYLQIADNPGRNEPGTGEVNWTRVFQEAKALGYDGYVGLECNPKDGEETAARRIHAADEW
jgi:hydroxypyruvate isomerase